MAENYVIVNPIGSFECIFMILNIVKNTIATNLENGVMMSLGANDNP